MSTPDSGLAGAPRPATATTARLDVVGLRKTFGGVPALAGLDLSLDPGEIHALMGQNGSGKSTLIKILSGYHKPDSGSVQIAGQPLDFGSSSSAGALGLRFVHQDLGLIESMSIADNIGLGTGFSTRLGAVRKRRTYNGAVSILGALNLGLDPAALVGGLTAAERSGVAIARALGAGTDGTAVLVLDEPTAALPVAEVDLLMETIQRVAAAGVGILYVSHRLEEIFRVAQTVTVLRDGVVVTTDTVAAMDRRRLTELMIGEAVEPTKAASAATHLRGVRPSLQVQDLDTGYVSPLTFSAFPGEILGIAGITGSGRESVLGAIFGRVDRLGGTVSVGDVDIRRLRPLEAIAAGMAYLPADRRRDGGLPELSARENVSITDLSPYSGRVRISRQAERRGTLEWLERVDTRPRGDSERAFLKFSGGNQQKILFAKWLRRAPAVFLLEEPTQGVDVGARARLHALLLQAAAEGMSVVVSSSDADELATVCSRILVIRDGKPAAELVGEDISVRRVSLECQSTEGTEF